MDELPDDGHWKFLLELPKAHVLQSDSILKLDFWQQKLSDSIQAHVQSGYKKEKPERKILLNSQAILK